MKRPVFVASVALSLVGTGLAVAHSGATGIVKERMESMKEMGAEMKIIGSMFQGKTAFNAIRIEKAAGLIGGHAAKFEKQFPKGSDHKPTRALPLVWKDKSEFDAIGKNLKEAAAALALKARNAGSVGDVKAELIAVGQACKTCHKKFRAPEK